jgi:DNA mismatch repair ATPase MutS
MNPNLQSIYNTRIQQFGLDLKKQKNIINQVALIRILEFLAGGFCIYYLIQWTWYGWAWVAFAAFGSLFFYLVKVHSEYKKKQIHLENLLKINQLEIEALAGKISQYADGKELNEAEHPYATDLDILGEQSIFQFLNRTCTIVGKHLLAYRLKNPSLVKSEILSRQTAVKELKELIDFRQNFQAYGQVFSETPNDKNELLAWLRLPIKLANKPLYKWLLWICPAITLTIFFLAVFEQIPGNLAFLPMTIQLIWVGLYVPTLLQKTERINQKAKFIDKYATLMAEVEAQKFQSSRLHNLQLRLLHQDKNASKHFAELARLIYNLENGASAGGILFNSLFMWSLQYLYRLECWQIEMQSDLEAWFEVIAEIDALNSLANLHFNHPDYTFPEIVEDTFILEGEELGHPLIDAKIRVNNPVQFSNVGQLKVITGANMAGKSTYLRTVGVNFILAMNGSPVCAKNFKCKPIPVYTSMRTKDSLQAHESFFYAELKRLKQLIEILNTGQTIFIILDEILKGTNSADQHTGSSALIEQLVKLGGVGLIATHDLTLGRLADIYPQNIENQCFEIEIVQDELKFDYKLKVGINQNLNATFLMKKMGITV